MTGRKYKNMITSTYDWKINTKEPDAGFLNLPKNMGWQKQQPRLLMNVALRQKMLLKTFSRLIYHTFMILIFCMIWIRQWLEFVRPLKIMNKS
ncbi:Single-stranded-DNA-specific exonuclease Rec [Streptococcus sp. HSISS2]|nr:Single-stranded-DNA-specific exonuclease Rec [Streptococcus sp. HSISS2]